tara:strand:- start:53796 stop:55376 length:1581 start_codon:yes stop_codon:yes gene_type:complete
MKLLKNKWIIVLVLTIILLLFLRVDFRFKYEVQCCSDDYSYYMHASTIALDFDLNYSNQPPADWYYSKNNKTTPIGFIGAGIFSAPFLYVGNLISNLISENTETTLLNYKLLLYSLSPIIYLLFSYLLIFKFLNLLKVKINKYQLLLFFAGSGITYFAFERFSMTHVYEVFTISALIYLSVKYYLEEEKISNFYSALIPITLLLSFLTRMSNFYIFIIPFIVRKLMLKKGIPVSNNLLKNKYLYLSSALCLLIYYFLTIELYGELIFNPQKIYGTNISTGLILSEGNGLFNLVISSIKTFFIVSFSYEFGIFWVAPIIFGAIVVIFTKIENFKQIETYLILLCFAQNIFIIHLWQTTASSYGFRYLLSLTPLCFLVFFLYGEKNKFLFNYLIIFSVLSNLSVLFFETTELTQLSTTAEMNSFGTLIRYVEPNYIKGLFLSFLELNSYLIIFTTSFVGATLFKGLLLFMGVEKLNLYLSKLGLPIENEDFQIYLDNLTNIGIDKFIFILILFVLTSYFIVFRLGKSK